MRQREFGADLLRCVATFFIIGVHFYLHNGFYYEPQNGIAMIVANTARWLFFTCVPLFAMLTGYLKCFAMPNRNYYFGIIPIAITWLLISFICIGFKIGYLQQQKTVVEWLAEILNYTAANYAWYIEMYFALFFLCPFLNMMFCREEKYHIALLLTMLGITFLPSIGNKIMVGEVQLDFVPNYITGLWPIAYYLIGAYIRIHKPQIQKRYLALAAFVCCAFKGILTYVTADGGKFSDGIGGGYSDWMVAIITVLIFLLCYQMDTQNTKLRRIAAHISRRCLIIYLISWIFDSILQPLLQPYTEPNTYWWVFWVHCIGVFALSLLSSEVLYPFIQWICKQRSVSVRDHNR